MRKKKKESTIHEIKKIKNGWATMGFEPTGRKICPSRNPALISAIPTYGFIV